MTTETMTIETGQLRRACEVMQTLSDMPNVKDIAEIQSGLGGLIKALDPGPPIEEVAGPQENGHLENRNVIESGSREIQTRFAKESIGIAAVELNRAYADFLVDGNCVEIPTGRIRDGYQRLRTAMSYLDIRPELDDDLPF